MYSDNITQKVAAVAAQILSGQTVTEKLHPNQQKIDVVDDEKIDAKDFAKLRAMKNKVKEEVEPIEEEDAYDKDRYAVKNGKAVKDNPAHMGSKDEPHHVWAKSADEALKKKMKEDVELEESKWNYPKEITGKATDDDHYLGNLSKKRDQRKEWRKTVKAKAHKDLITGKSLKKEDVEQIEEGIEDRLEAARAKAKAAGKPIKDKPAAPKSNVRKIEGSAYGGAKQKDEPEADEDDTPAKKTVKYGARQNYKRSTRVNESFTEMINSYKQEGLKFVADTLVVEEPTEEEFNAEIEKAQAKSEGKDKAQVAKASVQAVKQESVQDIAVINADIANGVEQIDIEERHMTDAEMNKREKIVKSMKKGLSGFKQRYGDKAKNVMYATATKQAMKD